jgi:hypothetical protein
VGRGQEHRGRDQGARAVGDRPARRRVVADQPTEGCRPPSGCPLVMAPAGAAMRRSPTRPSRPRLRIWAAFLPPFRVRSSYRGATLPSVKARRRCSRGEDKTSPAPMSRASATDIIGRRADGESGNRATGSRRRRRWRSNHGSSFWLELVRSRRRQAALRADGRAGNPGRPSSAWLRAVTPTTARGTALHRAPECPSPFTTTVTLRWDRRPSRQMRMAGCLRKGPGQVSFPVPALSGSRWPVRRARVIKSASSS